MTTSLTPTTAVVVTIILWTLLNWIMSWFMIVDNTIVGISLIFSLAMGIFINYLVAKNDVGGGGM